MDKEKTTDSKIHWLTPFEKKKQQILKFIG
jgi:hypothetical protein